MSIKLYFLWVMLALALNSCQSVQAGPVSSPTAVLIQEADQPIKPALPTVTTISPDATSTPAIPTQQPDRVDPTQEPVSITQLAANQITPTALPTLATDEWQGLPVVPEIGKNAQMIYQHGLALGNNPQAFSKIGDCGSTPAWFLGDFDRGSRFYRLGEFQYLQPVIDAFQGSFGRTSLAAKSGFNASSVFATLWSDRSMCDADETPIACEYRLNRPIVAFITLGSNDVFHQESFEPQMRKIIEFSIEQGVIPILSTKADNTEKDGSINATIASLAREYDLPLWNYWRAVQPLPDHGLQDDGVHLTWGPNRFDDPQVMTTAWAVRNLTALQTLEAVWSYVTNQPPAQP